MSDFVLIFIFLVFGAGFAGLFWYLKKTSQGKTGDMGLSLIKQDLLDIRREIREAGQNNMTSLQNQLIASQKTAQESNRIVQEVSARLAKLDETNKQVMGFAEQLQSLENILKNPKQRGILGEYALESLLERAFSPKQYARQYQFKNGEAVDFVLFIGDKILPVDSKFSLENYNKIVQESDIAKKEQLEKIFKQDLKNRIDETAKYIRPQENTFNFALMFIPAEGIYYDLLINEVGVVNTRDLVEYAAQKKVSIVSPNSFYAILQTILEGLRGFQIEKSFLEIRKNVEMLSKHLLAYDEYFKKLGSQIAATVNTYNLAHKEFEKIDKDVVKIAGSERQIEPMQIDKPSVLE